MLRKILTFFQKETVLSISAILAILSMFIVHPSGKYSVSYTHLTLPTKSKV